MKFLVSHFQVMWEEAEYSWNMYNFSCATASIQSLTTVSSTLMLAVILWEDGQHDMTLTTYVNQDHNGWIIKSTFMVSAVILHVHRVEVLFREELDHAKLFRVLVPQVFSIGSHGSPGSWQIWTALYHVELVPNVPVHHTSDSSLALTFIDSLEFVVDDIVDLLDKFSHCYDIWPHRLFFPWLEVIWPCQKSPADS